MITLFLFVLIIYLLFQVYDAKTHIIDATSPKTRESFTGDYEDYILGDIHINPHSEDPLAPSSCDETLTVPLRLPHAAAAAMGSLDGSWNMIYGDYSVTEKELDWLASEGSSRVSFMNGELMGRKYLPGRVVSDYDDKSLAP